MRPYGNAVHARISVFCISWLWGTGGPSRHPSPDCEFPNEVGRCVVNVPPEIFAVVTQDGVEHVAFREVLQRRFFPSAQFFACIRSGVRHPASPMIVSARYERR
jgi:hypothetical protein